MHVETKNKNVYINDSFFAPWQKTLRIDAMECFVQWLEDLPGLLSIASKGEVVRRYTFPIISRASGFWGTDKPGRPTDRLCLVADLVRKCDSHHEVMHDFRHGQLPQGRIKIFVDQKGGEKPSISYKELVGVDADSDIVACGFTTNHFLDMPIGGHYLFYLEEHQPVRTMRFYDPSWDVLREYYEREEGTIYINKYNHPEYGTLHGKEVLVLQKVGTLVMCLIHLDKDRQGGDNIALVAVPQNRLDGGLLI